MNMKNRGGREARKPKAAKNVKGKGQPPTAATAQAGATGAVSRAAHGPAGRTPGGTAGPH